MIRSFSDKIFNGKITINKANKNQSNILMIILEFHDKARPSVKAEKDKKKNTLKSEIFPLL